MVRTEHPPFEEHLGKDCMHWRGVGESKELGIGNAVRGCINEVHGLDGRKSCGGTIDDVCLYIVRGREPIGIAAAAIEAIKKRRPHDWSRRLPPGNTE